MTSKRTFLRQRKDNSVKTIRESVKSGRIMAGELNIGRAQVLNGLKCQFEIIEEYAVTIITL